MFPFGDDMRLFRGGTMYHARTDRTPQGMIR